MLTHPRVPTCSSTVTLHTYTIIVLTVSKLKLTLRQVLLAPTCSYSTPLKFLPPPLLYMNTQESPGRELCQRAKGNTLEMLAGGLQTERLYEL